MTYNRLDRYSLFIYLSGIIVGTASIIVNPDHVSFSIFFTGTAFGLFVHNLGIVADKYCDNPRRAQFGHNVSGVKK